MRSTSDVRRSSVAGGVALAVLLALVPMPPSAVADDDGEPPSSLDVPIPDGEWLGEMDAAGLYSGTIEGAATTLLLRVNGSFFFDVIGGDASGDWSWSGFVLIDVETPQADSVLVADTQAGGPIDGGDRTLLLSGETTTTGRVTTSAGVTDFGPNVDGVEPLDVRITSARCNTVVGDWITPLTNAMDTQGLEGSLDGTFVANYWGEDVDTDLAIRIDELYTEAEQRLDETFGDLDDGVVDTAAVKELVERAIDLEIEAEREQVCVFEDTGRYVYGPMARLLLVYLQHLLLGFEADGRTLWAIVDTLLFVNAIGSGADPNISREMVPLIEQQAQRVFEENLVDEGTNLRGDDCRAGAACLARSTDVDHLLMVADRLDLTFDHEGMPVAAVEVLQEIVRDDR